jgi:hypothetical protein
MKTDKQLAIKFLEQDLVSNINYRSERIKDRDKNQKLILKYNKKIQEIEKKIEVLEDEEKN